MTTTATARRTTTTTTTGLVRGVQAFAALSVLTVLFQFITAGQLFPQGGPAGAHAAGAIVLHVVSGVAAVLAVIGWRRGQLSLRLTVLAVVVFAYSLLQAAWGGRSSLWIHIPGAMVMAAGVVWLFIATLRRGERA